MSQYLNLDDRAALRIGCDSKARDLFDELREPELQVVRFAGIDGWDEKNSSFMKTEDVLNSGQLKVLHSASKDSFQLFFIRQDRSWTILNIKRSLFEDLISSYGVFQPFWKCVFTFGRKFKENNFEFPNFQSRRTLSGRQHSFECAYVLRRVELNNRALTEGQVPWSIRQSAVYHKFTPHAVRKSTFIIIAPSVSGEQMLEQSIDLAIEDAEAISPFNIHRLLIADSMQNWQAYMATLEEQLTDQSNRIVLARVGAEKKNNSLLMGLQIGFTDRQKLKRLEDLIIDLQVIFDSMTSYVNGVRLECERCCRRICLTEDEECSCEFILDELDLYKTELELHIKRSKILKDKAKAISHLLSDLLEYENAFALKNLAEESQNESKSMYFLTERSTKDAAAVKILTIITLVYLPTTIVANFFSTQFVQPDNDGQMKVSSQAWLLAAISIPLTAATIAMWWTWVRYAAAEMPVIRHGILTKVKRTNSLWSLMSGRRQTLDVENSPRLPTESPPPHCDSPPSSWSPLTKQG